MEPDLGVTSLAEQQSKPGPYLLICCLVSSVSVQMAGNYSAPIPDLTLIAQAEVKLQQDVMKVRWGKQMLEAY